MDDLAPTRPWWRRKRWGVALVLWLAGVYPLGYGPAFGYYWRTGDPRVGEAFDAVYGPMQSLRYDGPIPVSTAVGWYLDLWMPEGWDEPRGCCFGIVVDGPSPAGEDDGVAAAGAD